MVCGWLVFFRMSQTTALVKKAVMAVAGALTSDERLLLEEVIAAFHASTGLELELVEDPGGGAASTSLRLALESPSTSLMLLPPRPARRPTEPSRQSCLRATAANASVCPRSCDQLQ